MSVCLAVKGCETIHFTLDGKVVFVYAPATKDEWLIALWQLGYGFFIDFAEDLAVVDTGEIIVEYLLALIIPVIADDIFLYEVGLEVSREFPCVNEVLPRLLQILGDILCRLENVGVAVYRSKVVPSETFQEMAVLISRLHSVCRRVVVFDLVDRPHHLWDIEYPVKV